MSSTVIDLATIPEAWRPGMLFRRTGRLSRSRRYSEYETHTDELWWYDNDAGEFCHAQTQFPAGELP